MVRGGTYTGVDRCTHSWDEKFSDWETGVKLKTNICVWFCRLYLSLRMCTGNVCVRVRMWTLAALLCCVLGIEKSEAALALLQIPTSPRLSFLYVCTDVVGRPLALTCGSV